MELRNVPLSLTDARYVDTFHGVDIATGIHATVAGGTAPSVLVDVKDVGSFDGLRVEVRDVSLGGIKIFLDDEECVGKDVVITVESLRPVKGVIRWFEEGTAGIVFDAPLSFEELAEWLSKRIEVASLRAATQPVSRH